MAQTNGPNMFTTTVLAGLAGAALALLVAPRSGKETRQQMKNRAMEMKNRAKQGMDEKRQSIRSSAEETKDKLKEVASETKRGMREARLDNSGSDMAS